MKISISTYSVKIQKPIWLDFSNKTSFHSSNQTSYESQPATKCIAEYFSVFYKIYRQMKCSVLGCRNGIFDDRVPLHRPSGPTITRE